MTYLLNLVYLVVLTLLSPWILYRSIRNGRYRRGLGAKFFGLVDMASRERERPELCLQGGSNEVRPTRNGRPVSAWASRCSTHPTTHVNLHFGPAKNRLESSRRNGIVRGGAGRRKTRD